MNALKIRLISIPTCSKTGIVSSHFIVITDMPDGTQYGDSGWFTCGGYPGSWGNELRDLRTFSNWGFDYLKYDNCASKSNKLYENDSIVLMYKN